MSIRQTEQIYQLQVTVAYLTDALKYLLEYQDQAQAIERLDRARRTIDAFIIKRESHDS